MQPKRAAYSSIRSAASAPCGSLPWRFRLRFYRCRQRLRVTAAADCWTPHTSTHMIHKRTMDASHRHRSLAAHVATIRSEGPAPPPVSMTFLFLYPSMSRSQYLCQLQSSIPHRVSIITRPSCARPLRGTFYARVAILLVCSSGTMGGRIRTRLRVAFVTKCTRTCSSDR